MEKIRISIGIISDIVCPWCYIGKRRLEKAMQLASNRYDFSIEYFPFELNPHMPEQGTDFKEYLCRKYGSEERFHELTEHVRLMAAREALAFNLDIQRTSPNTRNIHRVIMLAREEGNQLDVVEAFFRAYFTEGTDLTNVENVLSIAQSCGLNRDRIEQLLKSNTGKLEIEMAEKELYDLGITSVPLFIIDNRFAISGAQSVETFTRAFEDSKLVIRD